MSAIKHPKSVQAAQSWGTSQKDLAEALFVEIPPRGKGRIPAGAQTVEEQLRETAAEIEQETGERISWSTLDDYRKVAAWVATGAKWRVDTPFSWADASWTAHSEAYRKGMSWAEFMAGKRTKRAVREQAGAATGDVPAAARAINQQPTEASKFVAGLDDAARRAVAVELGKTEEGIDGALEGYRTRPQAQTERRERAEREAAQAEETQTVFNFRIKSVFAPVMSIKAYVTELITPGDGRDFRLDTQGIEEAKLLADVLTSMAGQIRAWADGDTSDPWDRGLLNELMNINNEGE